MNDPAEGTWYDQYDGDGQRVKTIIKGTPNDTATTCVGNWFEWTGSTSTMKKYYYAGAQRIAMRTGSGTGTSGLLWIIGDHLGSTTKIANYDGTLNSQRRYKPWGEARFGGALPTTFAFTGQRQEAQLGGSDGLYDYGARWYDAALGRWLSPDSIVPEAVQGAQAWSRYTYVNNAPTRYQDPTGHFVLLASMLGGFALGAFTGLAIYSANVAFSGNEWNTSEALGAAGVGAVGGFLIGTGVGAAAGAATFAAIGAGAGVLGGQAGYSLSAGEGYDTGNMALSAAVSGVAGAVTGGAITSGAVTGANATLLGGIVNGTASTAGYALTTLNSGETLSAGMAGAHFVLGGAIGAVGASVSSSAAGKASAWMSAAQGRYGHGSYIAWSKACARAAMPYLANHGNTQFWRNVVDNAVQSYATENIPE